jgi:hypothetical protein
LERSVGRMSARNAPWQTWSLAGQLLAVVLASIALPVLARSVYIPCRWGARRCRIQYFIDRRFYRSKYDAVKTPAAFSARLRAETDSTRWTTRWWAWCVGRCNRCTPHCGGAPTVRFRRTAVRVAPASGSEAQRRWVLVSWLCTSWGIVLGCGTADEGLTGGCAERIPALRIVLTV